MLDDDNVTTDPAAPASPATGTAEGAPEPDGTAATPPAKKAAKRTRKSVAKKAAVPAEEGQVTAEESAAAEERAAGPEAEPEGKPARKTAKKAATKKTAAKKATATTAKKATAKKTTTKKASAKKTAAKAAEEPSAELPEAAPSATSAEQAESAPPATSAVEEPEAASASAPGVAAPLFQPPVAAAAPARSRAKSKPKTEPEEAAAEQPSGGEGPEQDDTDQLAEGGGRRRRRRGGRRRRKSGGGDGETSEESAEADQPESKGGGKEQEAKPEAEEQTESGGSSSSRRRRRRRRSGDDGETAGDEPENTVTKVRKGRSAEDEITALSGSTRLEAKRQRRREGREAGRRRAPIVSEAEFLARRESVDRTMVIRQKEDLTQIAVLEDKVLVEHYVARESQTSLIGNVYLGRVQNVLPSMEAAFIDIGKGRNAVLYAGEVNWQALGGKDGSRKIEQVLKSGQTVLVQVTKDPIGHKGARLTSQISLPGRFLVYVPDGTTSGISRKLPDTERNRLKNLLKQIVPESAGVIVRTAAEGASEDELTRDVERLTARWSDISAKVEKGNAPQLLYGEPDLTLKVVRDLFTEDFAKLVISGDDAWDMVDGYVQHVAPDLAGRLEKYDDADHDVFAEYRIDEQIAKGLDRKVWLPSGGSLIIDRTEAMTVIDVNTGKFTGSGGNLEETVTKNNLEAAEEIVRQLRLRDIGGIIVVDFIDMVLESNRDLVLRRMVECLGRDRTRHQVAEVTSLGLVQMTRKRIGTGLLEAFSESCEHCQGRGVIVHHEPVEPKKKAEDDSRRGRRGGRSKGKDSQPAASTPSPKDIAAMAKPEQREAEAEQPPAEQPESGQPPAEQPESGQPEPEPAKGNKQKAAKQKAEKQKAEKQKVEAALAAGEPGEAAKQEAEEKDEKAPEAAPAAAAAEPAAPKVVTRVRRRSTRPAGPPSGAASTDGHSTDEQSTNDRSAGGHAPSEDAQADLAGTTAVGHVPVKTKAGRRR
ncbi:MAG TPA: Rne/Rng family ribonuclease [Nocardioidaceae bacterium]|nr:Rne/Rng family ribonuclease [Nocardioidaceae bacterium]